MILGPAQVALIIGAYLLVLAAMAYSAWKVAYLERRLDSVTHQRDRARTTALTIIRRD